MGVDLSGNNKPWELSLYELNRKPQPLITDDTEIAVKPRSLQSELMCPICLDMLKNTMTTKECLHRFCNECICTALRSGNKECPTCRKKLVSRRSLRADPNFDMLISKIYPSREEYEKHQEMINSRLGRSIGIEENGQPTRKNSLGRKSNGVNHYQDNTNADTTEAESCASSTSYQDNNQQEVELVFKPLTQDVDNPENSSLIHTRFLKTTTNATVDHLIKYLSMRHFLETNPNNCENNQELKDTETSLFTIYKATGPGEYRPLQGQSTLDEIKQKFWKSDKPLELYYGYNVLTQ